MIKRVLTIAGSDSGGGAGIQADIKTFSAFKVYGMSVITAVTAQNTSRINGIVALSPDFIGLQIESIFSDIGVDGIKIGMLYNPDIVLTIAKKMKDNDIPIVVVDPVMSSKGGEVLLKDEGVRILKKELLPAASLLTPNLPEAEILTNIIIDDVEDAKQAALKIHGLGCKAVLITGGHFKGDPVDVLYDGMDFTIFKDERIKSMNTHGTGCTFSAAITSNLVLGKSLKEAIKISKKYLSDAISNSFNIGKGHGPLNHFVKITS